MLFFARRCEPLMELPSSPGQGVSYGSRVETPELEFHSGGRDPSRRCHRVCDLQSRVLEMGFFSLVLLPSVCRVMSVAISAALLRATQHSVAVICQQPFAFWKPTTSGFTLSP